MIDDSLNPPEEELEKYENNEENKGVKAYYMVELSYD